MQSEHPPADNAVVSSSTLQTPTDGAMAPVLERAAELGVTDALVFRRLSGRTWAHLGGFGRGRGWAGVVDVTDDPLMSQVPAGHGAVLRFVHADAQRVLGPYYAVGGALVRVDVDVVVVLGNPVAELATTATEGALRQLATELDSIVDDVAPAKRLADELEVLHAVRAITTGTAHDLDATLRHIVDVALQSLSCEVGLVRDGAGRVAATSSWPGVDVTSPGVGAALDLLELRAAGGLVCIQDTDEDPLLDPLGREHGVRSVLAVAIPEPVGGILVVAHTTAAPRGFTSVCQQLGRQIADAAGVVVHTAALREELREVAAAHARTAREDPLTGLGNRLAFDEALVAAQAVVDTGGSVTVLTLDVDGLKHVNDTAGHEAGDNLLRRCADVLREHGRSGDVCVRLGGDEFAVLMPHAGVMATHRLHTLARRLGGITSDADTVAASLGMATAHPGCSVADAMREADAAMYRAKRDRRTRLHR